MCGCNCESLGVQDRACCVIYGRCLSLSWYGVGDRWMKCESGARVMVVPGEYRSTLEDKPVPLLLRTVHTPRGLASYRIIKVSQVSRVTLPSLTMIKPWSPKQTMKAQVGSRGIALLFPALDGGWWSAVLSGRLTPWKQTRYPFYKRMDEFQGWSGRVPEICLHRGSIPGLSSP